jgi:hypothetical protein
LNISKSIPGGRHENKDKGKEKSQGKGKDKSQGKGKDKRQNTKDMKFSILCLGLLS